MSVEATTAKPRHDKRSVTSLESFTWACREYPCFTTLVAFNILYPHVKNKLIQYLTSH